MAARNGISLRQAAEADLDAVMAVETASFEAAVRESRDVFIDRIKTFPSCFVVFVDGGAVIGYLCAERWRAVPVDDAPFALGHKASKAADIGGKVLYISSFALLPQYRGKGLGESLFSQALDFIKGAAGSTNAFVLLVNSKWQNALRIYKRCGFAEERRIKGAFCNVDPAAGAEDGIVMVRYSVCRSPVRLGIAQRSF